MHGVQLASGPAGNLCRSTHAYVEEISDLHVTQVHCGPGASMSGAGGEDPQFST